MLAFTPGYPKSLQHHIPEDCAAVKLDFVDWKTTPDGPIGIRKLNSEKIQKLPRASKEAIEWLAEKDHQKKLALEQKHPEEFSAQMPPGQVWLAWGAPNNSGGVVRKFGANYTVPGTPPVTASPSQIAYFWHGLVSGNEILQPVLSWTSTGWYITPAYFLNGSTAWGNPVAKSPGDSISAWVLWTSDTLGGGWLISGGPTPQMYINTSTEFTQSAPAVVFEFSNGDVSVCQRYPTPGITFSSLDVRDAFNVYPSLTWTAHASSQGCSEAATINSSSNPSGSITLSWTN